MIKIERLTKKFGDKTVLDNVNLSINKGTIYGIIGYSGAGKSTLIRTLNALEKPCSGDIEINSINLHQLSKSDIRSQKKKIAMIFQHFNLLSSKTVFDNIALPLKLNHNKKDEIDKKVQKILAFVGLEAYAKNYPETLSGGQKQRVGIARALVNDPEILLCDEATSALDPETTIQILSLLKKVNQELGITIVLITHQMDVIKEICDRVAVLEGGKIIEENDIFQIMTAPQQPTTQKFIETVLHQKLPPSIIEQLKENTLYRLTFSSESVEEGVISKVTKETQAEFSILQGVITEIRGRSFGQLIVKFPLTAQSLDLIIQTFEKYQVKVSKLQGESVQ